MKRLSDETLSLNCVLLLLVGLPDMVTVKLTFHKDSILARNTTETIRNDAYRSEGKIWSPPQEGLWSTVQHESVAGNFPQKIGIDVLASIGEDEGKRVLQFVCAFNFACVGVNIPRLLAEFWIVVYVEEQKEINVAFLCISPVAAEPKRITASRVGSDLIDCTRESTAAYTGSGTDNGGGVVEVTFFFVRCLAFSWLMCDSIV